MIKKSLAFGVLLICLSLVFNFAYSQTSTTSSSTNSTSSESGDVYTRANETYKYVSSFDGSENVKTFDNQNTRDVGSVFNYLLTVMAVAIVLLVIYRLLQGAVIKGTFDNIYDQTKGRSYIKTAGTALIVFIFAYAILSFINPDLTGWTVATQYIGKVRLEGVNNGGTRGGSGAYTSAYAWQCPINPGGFKETQNYVQKVQGYQKEKPWEGSGANSGCKKYDAEFTKVASESGVPKDFLMAIGTQESGACSSLSVTSPANAYGLMQILDGTASSAGCDSDWKSTGYKQISCAAKVIKSKQSLLQSKSRPSIGFNLSGTIQNIEGYTFDTGNANLIASYNGGPGEGTTADGKKQAFAASSDCKGSTGGGSLYGSQACTTLVKDLKSSDLVSLSGKIKCNENSANPTRCTVKKEFLDSLVSLNEAYKAKFNKEIEVTSSYRTQNYQKELCGRTSGECASGCSNHMTGMAVDFTNATIGMCKKEGTCTSEEFKWLKENGGKFGVGFYNNLGTKDNIHWSYNGR